MTDVFAEAIGQSFSRMDSGAPMDIETGEDGFTRIVPQIEPMIADQENPFAIAGEVTPMTPGEFGEKVAGVGTGAVSGAITSTLGAPGDIAGLIQGTIDAVGAEEGQRLESFLTGLAGMSDQYGSEFLLNAAKGVIEGLPISDEAKQDILAGSKYLGEFGEIPGAGLAAKGLVKGAKGYIAGAPERVAERGTGMTLQSGVDPLAAIDEVIVGLRRVQEIEVPTEDVPGIIVFHGSGSDFDKFQLSKIGTGEGAQAFGRGLYFTDLEDIARFYRDAVGMGKEVSYKGRKLKDVDSDAVSREDQIAVMVGQQDTKEAMQILASKEVQRARDNLAGINQTIEDHAKNPDAYPLRFWGMDIDEAKSLEVKKFWEDELEAALEVEKNIDGISAKPAGKMYQAKLKVDPKKLLDYDKPISAQNRFVRSKIEELVQEVNLDDAVNLGFDPFELGEEAALQAARESLMDSEVVTFLNTWRDIRGVEGAAEELLDKYGIKGIKYKAMQGAGARNVPETGAQNYVIFDENLIEIMKKYGIVGSVAVSSVAATQGESEQGDAQ